MFQSILIANRGEIACRVIRTARRLGLRCIAVYSEADADAVHVEMADSAFCIGAAPASESYLKGDVILAAAKEAGAEAIHPGYGFLSENADFAEACSAAGIVFVGPPAAAIRAMGSKSEAKAIMEGAGVPLVPGYHGDAQDAAILQKEADKLGFPLMVKASAGGGGKGMRIVEDAGDFSAGLEAAQREAMAAFGDDHVLLERFLPSPRHVEIQVFRDDHGKAVHLFERDCSSQRRHQKVIEEAPAPDLPAPVRKAMGEAAVAAAAAIDYRGAGTVEFLFDGKAFYFMEMNTRLQVEHPVTEMITGVDLVEWQLRVASGEPLPLAQEELTVSGHAIEARIYAEDPGNGFLPSTGRLLYLGFPPEEDGLRVDSGVRQGDAVTVYYDPMIAKVVAWGEDRETALRRLDRALVQTEIAGVTSNVAFLRAILGHTVFRRGAPDTGFIDQHRESLVPEQGGVPDKVLAALALAEMRWRSRQARLAAAGSGDPYSPWRLTNGWRLNSETHSDLTFLDGEDAFLISLHFGLEGLSLALPSGEQAVRIEEIAEDHYAIRLGQESFRARVLGDGEQRWVLIDGAAYVLALQDLLHGAPAEATGSGRITAPMPGKVMAVLVGAGEEVAQGAPLLRLEAMKMEHTLTAPHDGRIESLNCAAGELVDEGSELVVLAEA